MAKKRHHFIPKAYLKSFCDDEGKLYVHRKDDPEKEIRLSPDNTGFHKYYYSQPMPDGGHDHDKFEDLFSKYETKWPGIVQKFRTGENVNDSLNTIYDFIMLQRVRVPAARDACEKLLAEMGIAILRQKDAAGELPPPPKGFEDILDHVKVSIDPHQSLHAMGDMIKGIDELLDKIGICVLHNKTDVPFLTSDNPVIWLDPSLSESEMQPYTVRPDGPIMLAFPVAPDLMIYGDSTMKDHFGGHGLCYSELKNVEAVNTMNRRICRFAYESVFANKLGFAELVKEHADVSPVIRTKTIPVPNGQYLLYQWRWDKRASKLKWKSRNQ